MIVPDANLLLYACDSSSPFHRIAAEWWTDRLNGSETIGIPSAVALAFVRVSTNGSAFANPLTTAEAAAEVRRWLDRPVVTVIDADGPDLDQALSLIDAAGAGGGLVTDALIAALGIRHRAVVHTADADFARFPRVRWYNPITGRRG